MNKLNTTPGPWIPAGPRISGNKPDWYDSVLTEYEQTEDRICEMEDWPCARAEQSANAQLISVAPELYEHLWKLAVGIQDHIKAGKIQCDSCEKLANEAMILLAKSRGETND